MAIGSDECSNFGIQLTPLPPALDADRLFKKYVVALGCLLVCVAVAVGAIWFQTNGILSDSALIRLSEQQATLSQRILVGAERGHRLGTFSATDQIEMQRDVDRFEQVHARLSAAESLGQELAARYFGGSDGQALNDRIKAYVESARAIIQTPDDIESISRLRGIDDSGLLAELNAIVDVYRSASESRTAWLHSLGQLALFSLLCFLLTQFRLVVLPGYHSIKSKIAALKSRGSELLELRGLLTDANDTLARSNTTLTAAQAQLAAALAESETLRHEQSEFIYALAHDLKAPGNTVEAILADIRDSDLDRPDGDRLDLILAAEATLRRMSDLIDDVLSYSSSSGAASGPLDDQIDMGSILQNVVDDLASMIRKSNAKVICGPTLVVQGFPNQLRILAQNLIANAIKFCPPNTIAEVRVACLPLQEPGAWQLVVQDNGIGIPAEERARIFGLFQRLHVNSAFPGTGLGLATCQRIATNHRGRIDIVSAKGVGSTFSITLRSPYEIPKENHPPTQEAA